MLKRNAALVLLRRKANRLLALVGMAQESHTLDVVVIREISGAVALAFDLNTPDAIQQMNAVLKRHGYRLDYDAGLISEHRAEVAGQDELVEAEIGKCPDVGEHPYLAVEATCERCGFIQLEQPEIDTRNRPNPP